MSAAPTTLRAVKPHTPSDSRGHGTEQWQAKGREDGHHVGEVLRGEHGDRDGVEGG